MTDHVTVAADNLAFIRAVGLAMTILATVVALPISTASTTTLGALGAIGFIVTEQRSVAVHGS